jgi:hypothetical protein
LEVNGELPEWSIGADSKSVVPFGVPGVRIPRSPLNLLKPFIHKGFRRFKEKNGTKTGLYF